MSTTQLFSGMDTEAKSSSRVLAPPGGASSNIFGGYQDDQPKPKRPIDNDVFNQSSAPQNSSPAHKDIRSRNQRQGDDTFRMFGDSRSSPSARAKQNKNQNAPSSPYGQSPIPPKCNTPRQTVSRSNTLTSPYAQAAASQSRSQNGRRTPHVQSPSGGYDAPRSVANKESNISSSPFAENDLSNDPSLNETPRSQRKHGGGDTNSFSSIFGSKDASLQKARLTPSHNDSHDNVFGCKSPENNRSSIKRNSCNRHSSDSGAMRNILGYQTDLKPQERNSLRSDANANHLELSKNITFTPTLQGFENYKVGDTPFNQPEQIVNEAPGSPYKVGDSYKSITNQSVSNDCNERAPHLSESNGSHASSHDHFAFAVESSSSINTNPPLEVEAVTDIRYETDVHVAPYIPCHSENVFAERSNSSSGGKVKTDVDEMTTNFSKVLGNYYMDQKPYSARAPRKALSARDAYNPITGEPIEDPKQREAEEQQEKKEASASYNDHQAQQNQAHPQRQQQGMAQPGQGEQHGEQFRSTRVSQPPGGRSTKLW